MIALGYSLWVTSRAASTDTTTRQTEVGNPQMTTVGAE